MRVGTRLVGGSRAATTVDPNSGPQQRTLLEVEGWKPSVQDGVDARRDAPGGRLSSRHYSGPNSGPQQWTPTVDPNSGPQQRTLLEVEGWKPSVQDGGRLSRH